MWASDVEMAKAIAKELAKALRPQALEAALPSEPPPFVPEKPKKHETWLEQHQRRIRDDIRAGRAVSANMTRPTPTPPRRPDQQQLQSNGFWSWWR